MGNLLRDLEIRELENNPISVAVIGAGQMGRGLVAGLGAITGMRPSMVIDVDTDRAREALLHAGIASDQVHTVSDPTDAETVIARGGYVVSGNYRDIPKREIDAVVEATGVPEIGARAALDAIARKQHIILLNVETDVTIGRILSKLATQAGVVYSVSAGDEPGATVELVEFARTMGLTVVAAGKGKNNTLDVDATPDTVRDEALSKGASPHMFCSFVDGTKTMVEMTAVANATGLQPERPGMRGMTLAVADLSKTFALVEQGGVLTRTGVVDFVHGIAPGVFTVVTTDNEVIMDNMVYLKVGDGPQWTLYRPYHLANLETPHTVAKAVLYHDICLKPLSYPVAETAAVAKRLLRAGEVIDGIGGYTVRGQIMTYEDACASDAVPLGVVEGAELLTDVPKGQVVRWSDVRLKENSMVVSLRRLQMQWLD
ncbi:MAG: NAD(P)H-dependent oxidoreductase [Sulfobacillus sp.]